MKFLKTVMVVWAAVVFPFAAVLAAGPAAVPAESAWVDVSHSLGFPLGGLGTGYSAFGKYGFVRVNFDGRPKDGLSAGEWEYTVEDARRSDEGFKRIAAEMAGARAAVTPPAPKVLERLQKKFAQAEQLHNRVTSPEGFVQSAYGFTITDGNDCYVLQTTPTTWKPEALPFASASVSACLPKGAAVFTDAEAGLKVSVLGFTPLLPHDLAAATLPVQVFDITVANTGNTPRQLMLALENSVSGRAAGDRVIFASDSGELGFAAVNGQASPKAVTIKVDLPPGGELTQRFLIAWHYPKIDGGKRYYTLAAANVSVVIDRAMREASDWNARIDAWHNSLQVPAYIKRLWFGSLASVMTSTVMTADPYFFEIETPHPCLNTMDVCVYSNWVYLVNWPELERMDMNQFFKATPTDGPKAGLIMHSLWTDAARYVEEPTFICRLRRDSLWFNDPAWTRTGFRYATLAANRVFTEENQDGLLVSRHGNQSYDIWRMPGISAYVNSAWIYGLASLGRIAAAIGEPAPDIAGEPLARLLPRALASYDRLLWNDKTRSWNLFFRTEGVDKSSSAESLFTDQLFGRWVVAIDVDADRNGLPDARIRQTLRTLYRHNLVEDPRTGFRGWVNGMMPGRLPDTDSGYHSRTFWFGAQLNLASLLGLIGDEAASLDVIRSVSRSLGSNVLAAGEWNRSINDKGEVIVLPNETCKDTPRFAPYPRYKSSWEYLIRLVGLTMNERSLYFAPFRTVDFALHDIRLAGMAFDITVQSGWTRVLVDGKPAGQPLILSRDRAAAKIEFLR